MFNKTYMAYLLCTTALAKGYFDYCRERSERLYFQDHSFSLPYPSNLVPHVINSRTRREGWVGLGWGLGANPC